jgi:hypothetical protein
MRVSAGGLQVPGDGGWGLGVAVSSRQADLNGPKA